MHIRNLFIALWCIPAYFLASSIFLMNQGCTFNVSMQHTEGVASDTIEDTATNTPTTSPTLTMPTGLLK